MGFFQYESNYSSDELSTIYHFPDITYNRSPLIRWLEYKMLPIPPNLKKMNDPLIMEDYERDSTGNVRTEDGSYLRVDENSNLVRDEHRSFITTTDEAVEIHTD